jgi:hypothetical protein
MALDDFIEPEVGVAVGLTATVAAVALSPTLRGWLRKGAVYGLAGLLIAKDRVTDLAHNVRAKATATPAAPEPVPAEAAHPTPAAADGAPA